MLNTMRFLKAVSCRPSPTSRHASSSSRSSRRQPGVGMGQILNWPEILGEWSQLNILDRNISSGISSSSKANIQTGFLSIKLHRKILFRTIQYNIQVLDINSKKTFFHLQGVFLPVIVICEPSFIPYYHRYLHPKNVKTYVPLSDIYTFYWYLSSIFSDSNLSSICHHSLVFIYLQQGGLRT